MKIKILDSFLNKEDLQELSSLNLKKVLKNEVKVYHNTVNLNNDIQSECISKESISRLQKNYHNKAIDILNELNPKKVSLYDYSEFHIIETGADYVFPIHDDTPNKLLSGVVYLKPENNTGTIFYENKNGDGKNEVPWRVNRAVFFSRSERKTWHSYKGDGKSNRVALVYNLMTARLKEVYKIENKSYFLGQLRYKLNPYLHRYLKLTI